MTMKSKLLCGFFVIFAIAGAIVFLQPSLVMSHCQVPCGIYDDEARLKAIDEHITTIEKAMKQVTELAKEQSPNYNQIVRWVVNKEKHAEELSDIVTYYFMAQRVKVADKSDAKAHADYVAKLTLLHQMLVNAMKAKQSTDLQAVSTLRSLLTSFKTVYTHAH